MANGRYQGGQFNDCSGKTKTESISQQAMIQVVANWSPVPHAT
jgi:hypothetical protein